MKSWGSKGTGPGQFNIPHSIAIDLQDNIYVGDRTNHRIQVFDTDGNFKRMFSIDVPPDPTSRPVNGATPTGERLTQAIGAPNSMCMTPGPNQVLFVGESTYPGRIFKVALDGTVLGVIGRSGRNLGQFSGAHALACPSEREIYVGRDVELAGAEAAPAVRRSMNQSTSSQVNDGRGPASGTVARVTKLRRPREHFGRHADVTA